MSLKISGQQYGPFVAESYLPPFLLLEAQVLRFMLCQLCAIGKESDRL
jgi:hypothetical protein